MKIRITVLAKIQRSQGCKDLIREALDISAPTMSRYVNENDENLTKAAALKVIGEYFNLTTEEILEEETKAA